MSCSVHDVIRFEKAGIPTVNVGTDAFVDEAEVQASLLGMPDYRVLWVTHPVAILDGDAVSDIGRAMADAIAEKLTG